MRESRGRRKVELSFAEKEALLRYAQTLASTPGILAPAVAKEVSLKFGVGARTVRKYLQEAQSEASAAKKELQ
eukprot:830800-Lingulodinium_polyedra.AAC.1